MARIQAPTASRLFRDLYAAEQSAAGYAELVALLENSARMGLAADNVATGIFRTELDRLRSIVEEMENDADETRDAILALGFGPEQYEAWLARRPSAARNDALAALSSEHEPEGAGGY